MEDLSTTPKVRFYLTSDSKSFLKVIAQWAYFLSIIGFIGIVILIVLAFYMGISFSLLDTTKGSYRMMVNGNGGMITAAYLFLAVVYFIPVYFLYRFATKALKSFKLNNNDLLNASFKDLKVHYKFMGVLTLILIALYSLGIVLWIVKPMATTY